MFTGVEIMNAQGNTLMLPLMDTSGGYEIKDIQGLEPVNAEITFSSFANQDGEQEQSSRRGKRNIVMKLGYSIKPEIRALRKQLYSFFMPKSRVRLRFYAEELDMFFVEIYGTVESCISPLFAKDPEATISILCADSDFVDPEPIAWNEQTSPYDTQTLLTYEGDIDTGFKMLMNVDRALPAITIHHRTTPTGVKNFLIFAVSTGTLVAGDLLTISTVEGDKGIWRTRSGTTTSLLYGHSDTWTKLYPGANYIKLSSGGAPIPYTIEYTTKYGGL